MNIKRAFIAFFIAAFVPGLTAILLAPLTSAPQTLIEDIFTLVIWYLFSVPIVFSVGFATLYLALKIKYGPVLLPPVVGCFGGILIANIFYSQSMNMQGLLLFTVCGTSTAVVAAIIYFRPWFQSN
jgi:Na+-transporting methylmalonyl-CoA/oxaloacetate decarboxylase beta subunit